jgi:hypothetical protein
MDITLRRCSLSANTGTHLLIPRVPQASVSRPTLSRGPDTWLGAGAYPSDAWCTDLSLRASNVGTLGPHRSMSNRPTCHPPTQQLFVS